MKFERFELSQHEFLIEDLTSLLHSSYAPLLAKGMRFFATYQSAQTTRDRLVEGEAYLGFLEGRLAATVTLVGPQKTSRCDWYNQEGVFHFGQFAVRLDLQGHGYGSRMMDMLENRARELGAKELALDTSERAEHLIRMYSSRGYRNVGHVSWDVTNYRSVVLSKSLSL